MSINVMAMVWKCDGLKPFERLVALAIADNANDDGWAYPSYELLIRKTCISRATLSKQIKILKGAGIIATKPHGSIGKGRKVNTYQFNLEVLKSLDIKLIEKSRKVHTLNSSVFPRKVQYMKSSPRDTISLTVEHEPSLKPSYTHTTDQSLRTRILDHFYPSPETIEYCKARNLPDPTGQNVLDEFINKNKSSGWSSANWQSDYRNWLQKFKDRQASNNVRRNRKQTTAEIHAVANAIAFK